MPAAVAQVLHPVGAAGGDPVLAFQSWLDAAMHNIVLGNTGAWTLTYVRQAGDVAVHRASSLARLVGEPTPTVDRIPQLQTMCVVELQGIMEAVSQQAVRAFANGALSRQPQQATARSVQQVIEKTGVQRGHLLISFMTVRAFSIATLDSFRAAGVLHVGTIAERARPLNPAKVGLARDAKKKKKWADPDDLVGTLTAGDDEVCLVCEDIHDEGPYTLDEAEALIPAHPRCVLPETIIEGSVIAAMRSRYNGPAVSLTTRSGSLLRVTTKHPVLTSRGWIDAGNLVKGDKVISKCSDVRSTFSSQINANNYNPPTKIEKIFDSLWLRGFCSVKPSSEDLHGDARFVDGDVDIVFVDRRLLRDYEATFAKSVSKRSFEFTNQVSGLSVSDSTSAPFIDGNVTTPRGFVSSNGLFATLDARHLGPLQELRFGTASDWNVVKPEFSFEGSAADTNLYRTLSERYSTEIQFDEIVNVERFSYHGHVYDLQTATGYMVAQGVVISNCRCALVPEWDARYAHDGFDPNEARDPQGKWTSGGAVSAFDPEPTKSEEPGYIDMQDLTKVGGKMGSNEGGTYKSTFGDQYYIKQPATKDHVVNELLAAKLYQLAGAKTMTYVPVKGGEHVATELKELSLNNVSKLSDTQRKAAQDDFAVHAWLANWDAVGTGGDNQVVKKGDVLPTTVDVGGSLKYRAQGDPKGAAFGDKVTETDTLRDPSLAPDAAKLFGPMTNEEIAASIKRVTDISNADIKDVVYKHMPDSWTAEDRVAMEQKLIARKNDLAKQAIKLSVSSVGVTLGKGAWQPPSPAATTPTESPHKTATGYKKFEETSIKTKNEYIKHMLVHGATGKQMKEAVDWPSMGVPETAKNLGLELTKTKIGGGQFLYKGTPIGSVSVASVAPVPAPAASGNGKIGDPIEAKTLATVLKKNGVQSVQHFPAEGKSPPSQQTTHSYATTSPEEFTKMKEVLGKAGYNISNEYTANTAGDKKYYGVMIPVDYVVKPASPAEATPAPAPAPAKYDIGTPHGNFMQALHEQGIPFTTKVISTGKPVVNVESTYHNPAAEVAKNHPLAEGSGGTYYFKASQADPSVLTSPAPKTLQETLAMGPAATFETMLKEQGIKYHANVAPSSTMFNIESKHDIVELAAKYHPDVQKLSKFEYYAPNEKGKAAPAPVAAPAPTTAHPAPTTAELEKAKKNTKLSAQYVPGAPTNHPEAEKLIAAFNAKYEGVVLSTPEELGAKVNAFKDLQANMVPLQSAQQKEQAAKIAQQKVDYEVAAAKAKAEGAAKLAAEEAKMNDPETKAHYEVLKGIGLDKGVTHGMETFIAKHKLAITPEQGAYIRAYVGSHYGPVNKQLRIGVLSIEQAKYAKRLNDALAKMPHYEGLVYRGASLNAADFDKYANAVGKVKIETQFTSAGVKGKLWGETTFHIQSKTAADIRSFNPGEGGGEVVFKSGTHFHVTKVDKAKKQIWMDEID